MILDPQVTINFLKKAIDGAISAGVPSVYFTYLLILPLLTTIIAVARHLFGLTTYGTFIPAIISIILLELGLDLGLVIFAFLYLWARLSRSIIKKTMIKNFKVNYLPRMAIFLLLISLGILAGLLVPSLHGIVSGRIKILPVLTLILLIQNLIETQITLSKKESQAVFWESLIFAVLGYFVLSWSFLRNLVLSHPGPTIIFTLIVNIYIGRYIGFRIYEFYRFKSIAEK